MHVFSSFKACPLLFRVLLDAIDHVIELPLNMPLFAISTVAYGHRLCLSGWAV